MKFKVTLIYFNLFLFRIGSADTLEIVASKSAGTSSEPSTPEDNINVVVRVRPLNEKEKRDRHGPILQFPGNGQIIVSFIIANPMVGAHSLIFLNNS